MAFGEDGLILDYFETKTLSTFPSSSRSACIGRRYLRARVYFLPLPEQEETFHIFGRSFFIEDLLKT
jgi:hypothetical protein